MKIWTLLFPTHSNRLRHFATALLIISLLGFADATFLTVEHYRGVIPTCTVVHGCDRVLTSDYSSVFGVPVSLAGAIFYLTVFFGSFIYLDSKRDKVLVWTARATVFGMLASAYFIFVQAFMLHSWCLYCLGSATTSTLLFITALGVEKNT